MPPCVQLHLLGESRWADEDQDSNIETNGEADVVPEQIRKKNSKKKRMSVIDLAATEMDGDDDFLEGF